MNLKSPLHQQITHIATVLDLDPSDDLPLDETPALAQARTMAARTRSAISLLAFVPPPTMADNLAALVTDSNPADDFEAVRSQLFDLAHRIQREDHITVQCEIREARFDADAVTSWLTDTPADLLLVDRPDDETGMTIIVERFSPIIRELETPVWFAGSDDMSQEDSLGRVVAAVAADLSNEHPSQPHLDRDVLDAATGIVDLFDAELHVLQASPHPAHARTDRKESLAEFVEHSVAPDGQLLVLEGDVGPTVSAGAEALDADLIVMGASGKSRWSSLLFGGVAESTLAIAPCDLLLVKPVERQNAAADTGSAQEPTLLNADALEEIDLLVNPRRYFQEPGAVAADENLTDAEKRLVLSAWEEELANEIENERMPQQVYESSRSLDELDNVQALLCLLNGQTPRNSDREAA